MKQKIKSALHQSAQAIKNYSWVISLVLSLVAVTVCIYAIHTLKNYSGNPGSQTSSSDPYLNPGKLIAELDGTEPMLGNPQAPVTIVQIADFQCPYCKKFFDESFGTLKEEYIDTGKAKLIFLSLAFLGQESKDAAEAALCAQDQGKFWEYHDELYKNQQSENVGGFSVKKLQTMAENLGLEMEQFNSCSTTDKHQKKIQEEFDLAGKYGLRVTPSFIINNTVIRGAQSINTLRKTIDGELGSLIK